MAVSHSSHPATPASVHSSFAQVLHAGGPNPARATELALYAWIVGRWDIDLNDRNWRREVDIRARRARG